MKTLLVFVILVIVMFFQYGCDKGPSESAQEVKKSTEEFLGLSGEEQVITNGITDFGGLNLSTAQNSSYFEDLPDLWVEDSPGSKSYVIRPETEVTYQGIDSTDDKNWYSYVVYYVTDKDCFYVQYDLGLSSKMTFYGPFDGNPREELEIKFKKDQCEIDKENSEEDKEE